MHNEKTLFLVRGLPGSGKSFVAKHIAPYDISADDCWNYDYVTDPRGFDVVELKIAHERCQQRVKNWMVMGVGAISVANTFTTEREMKPYLDLAAQYGYTVTTLIVENRFNRESVHAVPDETKQKMWIKLMNNIKA